MSSVDEVLKSVTFVKEIYTYLDFPEKSIKYVFLGKATLPQNDGLRITQKKGGSISFQNPFLLCPTSVWMGIRT